MASTRRSRFRDGSSHTNHLSLIKRAFMAADHISGVRCLSAPTQTQAALLARVNCNYVHWAIKREAQRAEIERGLIPLVPAELVIPKTNGTPFTPTSAPEIDDAELFNIAQRVGPDRMLAAAVAAGH